LEQGERKPSRPIVSGTPEDDGADRHPARSLTLELQAFAWDALAEECAKLGMAIEELVSFSVLYYLADRDSGRIARRLPGRGAPAKPNPLGRLLDR
jgi:hypothetical protein